MKITEELSLIESIRKLTELGTKTLVVTNSKNVLLGTLSDGDIRKAIIEGLSLEESISSIYNKKPSYILKKEFNKEKAFKLLLNNHFDLVPVIDDNKVISEIIFLDDLLIEENQEINHIKDVEVVIMAGGLGSRLMPLTKDIPKPMIRIGEKSIIEIIIEDFKKKGFLDFIITLNYKSDIIRSLLSDGKKLGVNIRYIEENEPLGTGGSLSLIRDIDNSKNYIITNADLITDIDYSRLVQYHVDNSSDITICTKLHEVKIPYGVVIGNKAVEGIEEKPNKTFWINTGVYVLSPNVIKNLDYGKYLDMPDIISKLVHKDQGRVNIYPITGYWKDIGEISQLEEVRKHFVSKK
ncbi:sugar phosphate nucleotidyltransferase [Candidatus Pseudothioglobus singularis]|nr:sugar phosphate nucleotidyltransferase [Candidatus Pseudothioglobus singularis]